MIGPMIGEELLRQYGEGMRDGFEAVLRLVIGESVDGAEPYSGPVPDELRAWAGECLGRVRGDRTAVDDAVQHATKHGRKQ